MATVTRFEDLEVWKKARELDRIVFKLTGKGNFAKDFELRNQERKSSGSIADNIAKDLKEVGKENLFSFLGLQKDLQGN